MLYNVRITGISPIIQHSAEGIDSQHPANIEKKHLTSKKGSNRTASDEARIHELETIIGFWLDSFDRPTVPAAAIRSCIETAARKLKQGGQVREGLLVINTHFEYDEERYGADLDTLAHSTQFRAAVVVQRARLIRVRPKFDLPWAVFFQAEADDELVDEQQLRAWLDIGGRRIGLGDWRPEKSGEYGRFTTASIEEAE